MSDLDEEINKVFRMPPKKVTKGFFITDLDERIRAARASVIDEGIEAIVEKQVEVALNLGPKEEWTSKSIALIEGMKQSIEALKSIKL